MAGRTGIEPVTSDVTGRRSNQLNYRPRLCLTLEYGYELKRSELTTLYYFLVGGTGFEPVTPAL